MAISSFPVLEVVLEVRATSILEVEQVTHPRGVGLVPSISPLVLHLRVSPLLYNQPTNEGLSCPQLIVCWTLVQIPEPHSTNCSPCFPGWRKHTWPQRGNVARVTRNRMCSSVSLLIAGMVVISDVSLALSFRPCRQRQASQIRVGCLKDL